LFSAPEVRIVEASAGSGKTYALAKRYVQLLINPAISPEDIPLKSILAITFTNKATIEMKERIIDVLKKLALDGFASKSEEADILSALGVSKEDAALRAHKVMEYIIRNYNYFQIKTIDSFINAVLSGCALKLNLSSRFEIKTDHSAYISYSVDALIERARNDAVVVGLLRRFMTQYLHVERKSGWLPRKEMLSVAEKMYQGMNRYGKEYVQYGSSAPQDVAAQKKDIIERIGRIHKKLPKNVNARFYSSISSWAQADPGRLYIGDLSSYFSYEAIPVNKGGSVPEELAYEWDALRAELRNLAHREAYGYFDCYVDIFRYVAEEMRWLTRKDDVLFLDDLNRQAGRLFDTEKALVPELYYRLAARLRHFLIDEFQDTSELQWRNLLPMIEEALATGGSLFYVGDKKQAIYGFRGGSTGLFDSAPGRFSYLEPKKEALTKNYRSCPEIVSFVNEAFSQSNLGLCADALYEDEKKGIARFMPAEKERVLGVFSDARQVCNDANRHGYVRIEPCLADTAGERNRVIRRKLTETILAVKKRFDYRDIAVLARSNSQVELFTGWLMAEGIPVESEKTLDVRQNPVVKEILSLLAFLYSPVDSLAFASFVTGNIFAGATGLKTEDMRKFIFARPAKNTYLYQDFRDAFRQTWDEFFEKAFVTVGFVPLYELAVSMIAGWKVMANFAGEQVFVLRLLEIILNREKEDGSFEALTAYLKKSADSALFVNAAAMDAVQMITMHKVKGLQFPVVIIPFLDMETSLLGKDDAGYHMLHGADGISLVRLNKAYAAHSGELKAISREKYTENFISELNVVYVALTRAQDELYAFVPGAPEKNDNPVRLLIGTGVVEHGAPCPRRPAARVRDEEQITACAPLYGDMVEILKSEVSDPYSISRRKSIERGLLLHEALSLVGNLEGKNVSAALDAAAARAELAFPSVAQPGEVRSLLGALAAKEEFSRLFYNKDGIILCEKEIMTQRGEFRRIDRLVVTNSTVEVIDYKASPEEKDAHVMQVKEYMSLLKDIYPGKKITGAILYLDTLTLLPVSHARHAGES